MQNNVKRTLIALAVSTILFISIVFTYFFIADANNNTVALPDTPDVTLQMTELDGVQYVGNGFEILEYTKSVQKGSNAKIVASSNGEAQLDISVYYASGKSASKVFSEKNVSADTDAVWEWTVPKASTTDSIRVVIRSRDTYATFYIDVV